MSRQRLSGGLFLFYRVFFFWFQGNGTVDHDLKNNHNRDNDHEQDHENDHEQYHENDHEHDQDIDDGWTDVTDRLYDKGAKYLVTHDFEATVPSFLGGGPGAKVRLSPKRILPDGGVIIRMDVLPDDRQARSPRFFHKMISKWAATRGRYL